MTNIVSSGDPCGVVANVVDCEIIVIEFELQLRYYLHFPINSFGKNMNSIIPLAIG